MNILKEIANWTREIQKCCKSIFQNVWPLMVRTFLLVCFPRAVENHPAAPPADRKDKLYTIGEAGKDNQEVKGYLVS
jgi:hypothetical protein